MYENYCKNISQAFDRIKIKFRPGAKLGLWTAALLPVALAKSAFSYPQPYFINYKICAIFSFGMLVTSLMSTYNFVRRKNEGIQIQNHSKATAYHWFLCVLVTVTIHLTGNKVFILSALGGLLSTVIYGKLLIKIIKSLPKTFTYGEATIVTQSIMLLIYTTFITLFKVLYEQPVKNFDISTCIIQIGLLGIMAICLVIYNNPTFRKAMLFYPLFGAGLFLFILLPLHLILRRSALWWIVQFLTADKRTLALIIHWVLCCMITAYVINKQVESKKKASTVVRKTFHLLAIAIFLPGFLYKCTTLYLSSGVVLGIFVALELIRLINLPPFAEQLQNGFTIYCDEKDIGGLALTPIYLLSGISLPLWLHPAPCDMTDSAGFHLLPLISGLITIGFGDTGASLIGTRFGKHRWGNSKKTVEGTLGCIFSQFLLLFLCYQIGVIEFTTPLLFKAATSVIITSFVEAFTTQVDNLVLPLVAYIITV